MKALLTLLALAVAASSPAYAQETAGDLFREPGAITFCTQLAAPPAAFMESDGSTPTGVEVDFMKAIGDKLGQRTVILNLGYSTVALALDTGKCDAVIASTVVTPERLEKYQFVEYMRASSALLVPKGNPYAMRGYSDLSNRRIAVQLGTINERRLKAASNDLVAAGKTPIDIVTYQSPIIAFNELQLGRVDGFVSGSMTLAYYLTKSNGQFELGGLPVASATYGIMLPRSETAKARAIARAYSAAYRDGTLDRIVKNWGVEDGVVLCDAKCVDEAKVQPGITALKSLTEASSRPTKPYFDIPFFLEFVFKPSHVLVVGLGITIAAATVSMFLGSVLGAGLALLAISRHRWLRWLSQVYVGFFRGTPVLVQLVLVYFGLPAVLGGIDLFPSTIHVLGFDLSGALLAGIITFSLHEAAFASEIFRAGIQSIDSGQSEAAKSLGMTPGLTMRRIILPQALRVILPPMANQCNSMIKGTSLLSVIAIPELFHVADVIQAATYRTFEAYLGISVYYLTLTGIITLGQRRLERMFSHTRNSQRNSKRAGGGSP